MHPSTLAQPRSASSVASHAANRGSQGVRAPVFHARSALASRPCALRSGHARSPRATQLDTVQSLRVREDESDDDDEDEDERAGPSALQRPDVRFVSLEEGRYTAQGRMLLRARAANVYGMLTDYGNNHKIFSTVDGSEVLTSADGDTEVIQLMKWNFLAWQGEFRVHLGVQEDRANNAVTFNLVNSSFASAFAGTWQVKPLAPGEQGTPADEEWCEVQHTLAVTPSLPIPALVTGIAQGLFVKQVESLLHDLKKGLAAMDS
ncbi:hypothetical protein HYH03_015716 [Edaphochlamys debaryana]|uniref:Coenzyme Q-binding protein COQ10 START domain-containing protein n=1 Tax=Edaphochlamys debaryana TaxID=47281 RepID=A0A836BSA9_9CHLO|nr:hypothetical protein HYH03_015716 [Edaphochlamys debaryana]|eukprot:KAG2485548.1 hypothetical protein HYH03_015716 [Edaphochlamys debaryana]